MLDEHTPMTAPRWAEELERLVMCAVNGDSPKAVVSELSRLCVSREEFEAALNKEAKLWEALLSEWTDRPMLVCGFEFSAGQVTIADILDHAARAYAQKQEQRAEVAMGHEWNEGRSGYGVQCKHCGTIQWAGISASGVVGNLTERCRARAALKDQSKEAGDD